MQDNLINFLIASQNSDGGWGYFPGKKSAFEPTAYAIMGLHPYSISQRSCSKAREFIQNQQLKEGGWPFNLSDNEPSPWISAIVGLSILVVEGNNPICQFATQYITNSFGKTPFGLLDRFYTWLKFQEEAKGEKNLSGWTWQKGTAVWVEPTCYALIFLKKNIANIRSEKIKKIMDEGELLIYDRMCINGGWNYGNVQVLGEQLPPFTINTAIALISLQNYLQRSENQKSLNCLKQLLNQEKSPTTLCYGSLCLDLYAQNWQVEFDKILNLYNETQFFQSIKTAALALLVLQAKSGNNIFKF